MTVHNITTTTTSIGRKRAQRLVTGLVYPQDARGAPVVNRDGK